MLVLIIVVEAPQGHRLVPDLQDWDAQVVHQRPEDPIPPASL